MTMNVSLAAWLVLCFLMLGIALGVVLVVNRLLALRRQHVFAQRAAAHAVVERLQVAHAALFGTEYLAASEVVAWAATYRDACTLAADRGWSRWLLPADAAAAHASADDLCDLSGAVVRHNQRFVEQRIAEEAAAFDRVERFPLTQQQRRAIVTSEDATLVIAGAGTGKTSTIVGKVDYVLRRGLAQRDDVLVLAFGTKAAVELRERLARLGHRGDLTVSTFHAFGRTVITAVEGRPPLLSRLAWNQDERLRFLGSCVVESWADATLKQSIITFFASMLEESAARDGVTDGVVPMMPYQTLTGQQLKSHQEVRIADWLTLHGIAWEYERPYPVATATATRRQYQPDFYLPGYDVYLEHFGIDHQGNTRADIDAHRYRVDMDWKRAVHRTHGTTLLETFSYFDDEGGLTMHLERVLREQGIVPQPIDGERLATLLRDAAAAASPFVRLLDQFLQVYKGNNVSRELLGARSHTARDRAFVDIFHAVLARYESELARSNAIDFHDMINQARAAIEAGTYQSRFRAIIVDEFQDISHNRLALLLALRAQLPHCRLYMVGDDWQSIFRFTGSDVGLITQLATHAGPTARVDLDQTFRYGQELLDASARFVMANPAQLRKTLHAHNGNAGIRPLVMVYQSDATPAGEQQALLEICRYLRRQPINEHATLAVLGRYRHTTRDAAELAARELRGSGIGVEQHTMHAAKGKEATDVILVGLRMDGLTFPATIADDPVMRLVLSEGEAFAFAEERRLMYVALTRAKRQVFLIVPPTHRSLFVTELLGEAYAPYITTLGQPPVAYPCPVCKQSSVQQHTTRGHAVAVWRAWVYGQLANVPRVWTRRDARAKRRSCRKVPAVQRLQSDCERLPTLS